MSFGTKIEFASTDFEIRKTEGGKEYISLRPNIAFNEEAVKTARSMGVSDAYKAKDEDEDED